jgi:hypothetical protein
MKGGNVLGIGNWKDSNAALDSAVEKAGKGGSDADPY